MFLKSLMSEQNPFLGLAFDTANANGVVEDAERKLGAMQKTLIICVTMEERIRFKMPLLDKRQNVYSLPPRGNPVLVRIGPSH